MLIAVTGGGVLAGLRDGVTSLGSVTEGTLGVCRVAAEEFIEEICRSSIAPSFCLRIVVVRSMERLLVLALY